MPPKGAVRVEYAYAQRLRHLEPRAESGVTIDNRETEVYIDIGIGG